MLKYPRFLFLFFFQLDHKLANGFDDLEDDEASSVNSSGNFTLDNTQNNGKYECFRTRSVTNRTNNKPDKYI